MWDRFFLVHAPEGVIEMYMYVQVSLSETSMKWESHQARYPTLRGAVVSHPRLVFPYFLLNTTSIKKNCNNSKYSVTCIYLFYRTNASGAEQIPETNNSNN